MASFLIYLSPNPNLKNKKETAFIEKQTMHLQLACQAAMYTGVEKSFVLKFLPKFKLGIGF